MRQPLIRETWFGVALMTALMGGSFIAVTWWNAHELDNKELERERAANHLRRREEEYKALAEHSPDIIARFDADLRYIYANAAVSAYTGAKASALLGKQSEAWLAPAHQFGAWNEGIRNVLLTKVPRTVEFGFQPTEGDPLTFQARLVPELDVDGSLKSVLVVSRDITALRRAYEELRQADRHKDQFLAIVGHGLRIPLNFVMGFLSFLQEGVGGALNAEQPPYADKAMGGAGRLLGLVNDQQGQCRTPRRHHGRT